MSRVGYRIDVDAWLLCVDPVHVGGLGGDHDTDLALALDTAGRYIVPGTGLTGALRHCSEGDVEPHQSDLRDWWGFVKPGQSDSGQAARVMVHDGIVLATRDDIDTFRHALENDPAAPVATAVPVEFLDGVGIDRYTGAAADQSLYNRQVLPAGSVIPLGLRIECAAADVDEARRFARDLLTTLRDGEVVIGAGGSRGLGRVKLLDDLSRYKELDLTTRDGFLTGLGQQQNPVSELLSVPGEATFTPLIRTAIVIEWEPVGPVMVKAGAAGQVVDAIPLTGRTNEGELRAKIPGSSVKGALRVTAERILATMFEIDDLEPSALTGGRQGLLKQLNHDDFELAKLLFGIEGRQGQQILGKAAVTVLDCWATTALDPDDWWALTVPLSKTEEGTVASSITEAGMTPADRVAIDRWTGGAAEGLLFSLLEPHGLSWESLELRIDRRRMAVLGSDVEQAAWALLYLTLREMRGGRVTIGFGSNRGMGEIDVGSITFQDPPGEGDPFELFETPAPLLEEWATGWTKYLSRREAA